MGIMGVYVSVILNLGLKALYILAQGQRSAALGYRGKHKRSAVSTTQKILIT